MSRKGKIAKRDVLPDPVYNSKLVTRLTEKRKAQAKAQAAAPAEPSAEVKLLTEIRDLLKAQESQPTK